MKIETITATIAKVDGAGIDPKMPVETARKRYARIRTAVVALLGCTVKEFDRLAGGCAREIADGEEVRPWMWVQGATQAAYEIQWGRS